MKKLNNLFKYFILFLSLLLIFTCYWLNETFGLLDMDKLLFHMFTPLNGTSSQMIKSYIFKPLLLTIITFIMLLFIFNIKYKAQILIKLKLFKSKEKEISITPHLTWKITFILLIYSISFFIIKYKVINYLMANIQDSFFIEQNYIDPKNTNIVFPEKKRNLIYIFLESMEFTYSTYEEGGVYYENYIPNLTKLANEETSFRNEFNGGFTSSRSTTWTASAIVGQTAGIGLYDPFGANEFGGISAYLPGAYSLGEILEENDYKNVFFIGSDAAFAHRGEYFSQHGNYEIRDLNYAKQKGLIPEDYYVWWGYEDSKLFEFAKEEILELANEERPFNFTMLTTNTHHVGGLIEEDCDIKFDEHLKNAIYCSDKQIYDFVNWIKEQNFYDNTTIVLIGDHLSMEPTFFNNIDNNKRTIYNVFINPYNKNANTTNRNYSTLDIYPAIISSIGGTIQGNKLGLGTNLFSEEKTLYEEYGKEYVETELKYNSKYYKKHILYGK